MEKLKKQIKKLEEEILIKESELRKKEEQIEKLKEEILNLKTKTYIEPAELIKSVCQKYGVGEFELGSRNKQVMEAKKEIVARLRGFGYTYQRISDIMGFNNHTTAIYLYKNKIGKQKY